MIKLIKKFSKKKQAGVALVVTLSMLVLVTIAAMAFFERATANRKTESTRSNLVLVDQVAKSAESYVIGQFLTEIADPANNDKILNNGTTNPIYQPKAANMLPLRKVAAANTAATFPTLIRQSVQEGGADSNASVDNTATASANGRTIRPDRWDAPQLHIGGVGNGTTTAGAPNWIYLQKNGTATATPTADTIGRFAYNVYDTGGLLDANVAGNPGLTGTDLQAIKGTLAGADLSVIPGITSATDFVKWRNPDLTGANYATAVTSNATNGFLSFSPKALTSRLDLIRLAKTGTAGISTSALPYLTHFSRSSNAPSWGPTTNATGAAYQYATNANTSTSTNRFLPNVLVKTAFTRIDGTTAKVGEPLLKARFPLSKLAWLGMGGPVAPGTAATIQRDFGLAWDNTNKRWNYVGNTGSTVQTSIKTLEQVATDNREPNFFELLKAGILSGSLGKASVLKTLSANNTQFLEANTDLQIIRIGACILDQSDTDNFPSRIFFGDITQSGIEDLPYLYGILTQERWRHDPWGQYNNDDRPTSSKTYKISQAVIWVPKLWNPHRVSLFTASAPTKIRAKISAGQLTKIQHYAYNASGNVTPLDVTVAKNLPANTVEIASANFEIFRGTARPPDASIATSDLQGQLNWWNIAPPNGDNYCGFVLNSVSQQSVTIQSNAASSGFFANIEVAGAMMVLEYLDQNNTWRIYDSLAGNADLPSSTGITTGSFEWAYGTSGFWSRAQNSVGGDPQFSVKWDPRSNRWGPCHGWSWSATGPAPVSGSNGVRRNEPFIQANPNGSTNNDDTITLFGLWPQGNSTWDNAGRFTLVPGADDVFRPNDAYKGAAANPFQNMGDTDRRPVILQRPFRSVAELGYVFRDTPWQSLNLFDSTSADSALLDLFSAGDGAAVSAGQINLNRISKTGLQSILTGASKAPDGSSLVSALGLATDILAFRNAQAGEAFLNKDALVSFISSAQFSTDSSEVIKGRREAAVRGLADVSQTNTWNLTADIVVQSGRFPQGTTSFTANRFIVEGDRRDWLHFAIDRFTGIISARSNELITE